MPLQLPWDSGGKMYLALGIAAKNDVYILLCPKALFPFCIQITEKSVEHVDKMKLKEVLPNPFTKQENKMA